MKTAIVIANGLKQLMLTAETSEEKEILKYLSPNDDISIEIKMAQFCEHDIPNSSAGYLIQETKGGYMKMVGSSDSIMFVMKTKTKTT